MISELKVGVQVNQDGAQVTARAGKDGGVIVYDAHARLQEAVYRGNVYSASNQAGQATPAGLNGTASGFVLYNPIASGKNLVLWSVDTVPTVAFGSTSTGAVALAGGVGPNVVAPTGVTALNIVSNLLNPASASVAKAYSTATFAVAPTYIRSLIGIQDISAVGISVTPAVILIDGSIILPPGVWICVATTVAETLQTSMIWEEIPI